MTKVDVSHTCRLVYFQMLLLAAIVDFFFFFACCMTHEMIESRHLSGRFQINPLQECVLLKMWQHNWYLHLKRTSLSFWLVQMLAYCSISIEIQATDGWKSWLLTQQWGDFDGNISKLRCQLCRFFQLCYFAVYL